MGGRLLRVTGTVLAIAIAFVAPVLATSAPAGADTVVNGCTIVSNPTPTNFTNCPGANLDGQNLSGLDLSYANLSGAVFSGIGIGNLSGADLSHANLSSARFAGEDLSNANLSSANLTSATLVGVGVNDAIQPFAIGTTMTGDTLTDANLTDVAFALCIGSSPAQSLPPCAGLDLNGDDLSGATLTGATFQACQPPGVSGGCVAATFTGATLTGANFTGTPLVPQDQSVTATSSSGAVVTWPTPAGVLGATPGSCTPASGSTFPLGTTTVSCQVLDDSANVATGTFTVTVSQPPPPTTFVGIPSNGATVSGATWLDAGASSPIGIASVTFEVSGGPNALSDQVVGSGTPTIYGYIGGWNTTTVPNGSGYTLQSVATDTAGTSTTSAPVTVTVNNPPPSTTLISPQNGATEDPAQGYVLDAVASTGATSVSIESTATAVGTGTVTFTTTPTIYGWLNYSPATPPPSGDIGVAVPTSVVSVATYPGGVSVTSPPVNATFIVYIPQSSV